MVVGYIDFFIAQSHAKIKVLAFKRANVWVRDENEILDTFQPDGYVFEPSFAQNNEMYKEKDFIIFEEIENPKAVNYNDDIFKIKGKVKNKLEYEVISAPKFINDEFSINYNYIQANIDDLPNNFFLKNSFGYYGQFIKQDNVIRSNKGTTVSFYKNLEENIISHNDRSIIFDIPSPSEIQIDFTSDDQLVVWFKKLLKTSASIDNNSLNTINVFLSSLSFDDDKVNKSRLLRIGKIIDSITLTFDELKILVNTSQVLTSKFTNVVNRFKNDIIDSEKSAIDQDLKEFKLNSDSEKALINREIQKLKQQLSDELKSERLVKIAKDLNLGTDKIVDFLNSKGINIDNKPTALVDIEAQLLLFKEYGNSKNKKLSETEEELKKIQQAIDVAKNEYESINDEVNHLSENREAVIRDMQLILDITRPQVINEQAIKLTKSYIIEEVFTNNSNQLSDEDFENNFIQILRKRNKTGQFRFSEIKKIISTYNCSFSSNLQLILAFIEATNNAIYTIIQVEPRWLSFKDLVDNGLSEMWHSAFEQPEILHFIIIRDVNLSSPECYANPLLDLDKHLRSKLPYTEKPWPDNLRIIGTIQPVPEIGLSIIKSTFDNWGGLPLYDLIFTSESPDELKEQKLSVKQFNNWKCDRDDISNYLGDYIS